MSEERPRQSLVLAHFQPSTKEPDAKWV